MGDADGRFTDAHRRRLAERFTLGMGATPDAPTSSPADAAWATAGMAVMAYLLGCEVGTVSATDQQVGVAFRVRGPRAFWYDRRARGWRLATDAEQEEDRARQASAVKAQIRAAGEAVADARVGVPLIAVRGRGAHVRRRLEVKRNWTTVAALAALLGHEGTVDGARAMALLRSAIPRRAAA
jgi:hypothetical protein